MIYRMPFWVYALTQKYQCNEPLSLQEILKPFQLPLSYQAKGQDPFLLVGHLMEELYEQNHSKDILDPLDIATIAWELGHEPARVFLEDGPMFLYHLMIESQEESYSLQSVQLDVSQRVSS